MLPLEIYSSCTTKIGHMGPPKAYIFSQYAWQVQKSGFEPWQRLDNYTSKLQLLWSLTFSASHLSCPAPVLLFAPGLKMT